MNPYLAQIVMFAGKSAPRSWAFCDGQQMPIEENPALFSLLGTTFGGDGQVTFALPDLRGRIPVGTGKPVVLGQMGGAETFTLRTNNLPAHNHQLIAFSEAANDAAPAGNLIANTGKDLAYTDYGDKATMAATAISITGQGTPITNVQPYLAINFIIAVNGIYPSHG
jgi:microcystin-dependent protein